MAVSDKLPEIEVQVLVEGEPAVEYEPPVEYDKKIGTVSFSHHPKTVVKYVECLSNAYFAIKFEVDDDYKFDHDGFMLRCLCRRRILRRRGWLLRKSRWVPKRRGISGRQRLHSEVQVRVYKHK